MPIFHQQTKHSYTSVRKNTFFLDWRTQPKSYKTYPNFHQRFKIDDYDELKDLNLIGGVTFEKNYPEGMYYLRTNPSAGGLYPCEIYIQIRGIRGLLNGIYHYEPIDASLCLLHELNEDGVEFYTKDKTVKKGLTFLISSVYFRSSWKYRDRSIRYILLDSGHQLGSIYAALYVMQKDTEIVFNFDKLALNHIFNFRDDEMFMACVNSNEKTSDKETSRIKNTFSYVGGCDYHEQNSFIINAYNESVDYKAKDIKALHFFDTIPKETLKNAILNRRSIRAFKKDSISIDEFNFILDGIFDFAKNNAIDIFYTVHNIDGLDIGLYKNSDLIQSGYFNEKSKYLSLEQKLGGDSCATFYFTSNDTKAYQKVNMLSGFLAQIIYLKSTIKGIGCSGIGAYYDDVTKEFLNTKNNILYLLAIGR